MRIWAFAVTHWKENDTEAGELLTRWRRRVDRFIDPEHVYLAAGTASPAPCPINVDNVIDIGLEFTLDYNNAWSYLRSGFVSGLYHALLNRSKWDLLVHVQDRTLVGVPIQPHLEDFYQQEESLMMAPRWESTFVPTSNPESGFVTLKEEGVRKYLTESHRASLSPEHCISVEEELRQILGKKWFNPWPDVRTTRRRDVYHPIFESALITDEEFAQLPVIAGGKHCSPEQEKNWCDLHPIS